MSEPTFGGCVRSHGMGESDSDKAPGHHWRWEQKVRAALWEWDLEMLGLNPKSFGLKWTLGVPEKYPKREE